jgi:hypothetical protein
MLASGAGTDTSCITTLVSLLSSVIIRCRYRYRSHHHTRLLTVGCYIRFRHRCRYRYKGHLHTGLLTVSISHQVHVQVQGASPHRTSYCRLKASGADTVQVHGASPHWTSYCQVLSSAYTGAGKTIKLDTLLPGVIIRGRTGTWEVSGTPQDWTSFS